MTYTHTQEQFFAIDNNRVKILESHALIFLEGNLLKIKMRKVSSLAYLYPPLILNQTAKATCSISHKISIQPTAVIPLTEKIC